MNLKHLGPIPCGSIMQKKRHFGIKDTFISNSKAYEEIIYKIKRLKSLETTHFSFDNRIEARINLNSGDSFQLCIALFNGIMLNGKFMGENDSLAYLIKANSGYYNYFQKERLYSLQEISKFGIPNNYKNWIRIQDPNKPQFSPNEIWLN